jgi:hypothetical protein
MAALGEEVRKGLGGLLDRGRMQIDPICAAQERRDALVEEVGDRGRETREDQGDGKSVADEVLDARGECRDLGPLGGMDLIDRDEQAGALLREQRQQPLPEFLQPICCCGASCVVTPKPATVTPVIRRPVGPSPNSASAVRMVHRCAP